MARYMHIVQAVAINAIEVEDPGAFPEMVLVRSDTARIGDGYNAGDGTFTTPPPSAESVRLADLDGAIASDTTVAMLKAMNNADFDAWWSANVTTLAQANNILKRLARIVLRRVL